MSKEVSETGETARRDYVDPPPAPLLDMGELKLWSFYRALIAEFVATLLFLYVTVATVIGYKKETDPCGGVGILGIAWAFGGMIFVLVYCTAGISGGHINPAVTFGLFLARKVSLIRALGYMVAQCLGAISGVGLVKAFMKSYYNRLGGGANSIAPGYNKGTALGAEIIGTFVLVYTVFSATDPKRSARDSHVPVLAPLPIGFAVFMVHLATIPITGTGINPARSFGAAVIYNNEKVWDDQEKKMTQDVEMKEQPPVPATAAAVSNSVSSPTPVLQHLKDIAALIETGAYAREVRRILRAVRLTIALRRKLKASVVSTFLQFALVAGSEAHTRLSAYLPKDDENDMEVDTASSAPQATVKHSPELEIYCYLLVLIFLIDQKKYTEAKACSSASIARLKNLNRRTVDVLASRLYFYYSLSYELTDCLSEIRGNLLALHRVATLRHDELGQETLLNLLLRNYLHYNLYDQAEKLRSKAPRFEAHSNQQFCRYLFYLGKIRTIQLEYTDAKESLLQAARKAPVAALGFRVQCNKWAVIVRLLLGEIPERTVFMQKGMEKALRPYFELTNAVRIGDLELFKTTAEKFSSTFTSDRTNNLIVRLRHNVIRTGLRNISISYSRISLADVAKKLRLDSPNPVADAESIVSKAIRDGAIDATLDHANGWMVSKETGDIYSTNEPQLAFNSRIAFCLNMHNEAVRALRFPPNSHKEKESAEKRRERQQQEQELAKHIAEEDDDDF